MGPAAVPIIMGVMSAAMQMRAASAEAKVAKANAARIREENEEDVRKLGGQHELNIGAANARAAASGVKAGVGSQKLFVDTLKSQQQTELAFLKRSGGSRAAIALAEGKAAKSSGQAAAFGSFAGGMSSGAQMGAFGPP